MRWLLQPTAAVEVWAGMQFLGTLSGMALTMIVHHHLASAQLAAAVQAELQDRPPGDPRRPPTKVISHDQKATLRAARREQRKRRRAR